MDARPMKPSSMLGSLLSEIGQIESLQQALMLYKRLGMGAKSISPRTRVEYENDLNDLIAFLAASGVTHLAQVGLAHLRIYQTELERRGYKATTRNRKTFTIKGFFTFLHDYALTNNNIAAKLIPPQAERGEPRFLSEAEYTRLVQACSGNVRDTAILQLFLQTGIQLSELVGLSVNDVTLVTESSLEGSNTSTIRIHRGGGHVTIPLNHKAQNALKKWLEIREPVVDTTLFLTVVQTPIKKRAVQLMVEKYLTQADVENASVQSLRHTMAVHHLAKGTPLKTLAEILGDRPDTLQAYEAAARKLQSKALQENAL